MADFSNDPFVSFVQKVLEEDLQPLLHIATTISYFIGLCLILVGMTRLYRHGSGTQSMMHRASPMSTALYFAVGVVLVSFMPYIQMLSGGFFDASTVLTQSCKGTSQVVVDYAFRTSSNDFCPMYAYSNALTSAQADSDITGKAIEFLIFGILFFVGIISFIRGMLLLIKLGEGGGQGQGVGKAMTHIVAGIIGVNADGFYSLMQNILQSNISS